MRTWMVLRSSVVGEIYISHRNKSTVFVVTPFPCLVICTSTSIPRPQLCMGCVCVRYRVTVVIARESSIGPEATKTSGAWTFAGQSERIDPLNGIWRVLMQIEATLKLHMLAKIQLAPAIPLEDGFLRIPDQRQELLENTTP